MTFEILIPIYNEAPRLRQTLAGLASALRAQKEKAQVRFWWADDGSTDGSAEELKKLVALEPIEGVRHVILRREQNRGKGAILRHALGKMKAVIPKSAVVGFWDADGELDPRGLIEGLELVGRGDADIVFGTRFCAEKPGQAAGLIHRAGNWVLTAFSNFLSGLHLSDVHCCARMLKAETLFQLPLQSDGFEFEAEFVALVGRIRQPRPRIQEVPLVYSPRTRAEGKKIGLAHVVPQLRCAIRCRALQGPIRLQAPILTHVKSLREQGPPPTFVE